MKRSSTTALLVGVAVLLGMLGVMQVAVAAQHVSVTRSFDTESVTAGGELEVTIDISSGWGLFGLVVETLPDGFSYVSGSSALVLDEDDITVDGSGRQMVPFSLLDETTFTYMVAVSSDPMPPHTFSGVFTYGLDKDTVNIAESSVTVEQPSTSLSASRSFDTTTVIGGGELEVTIDISGEYGGIGQVVEKLPDGFSYVSGSSALVLDENDITVDDDGRQMVPFSLLDETTFTYMVAVSSDPMPPHTFSGVFTYGLDKDTVNIGESSVTVEQPSTSLSASRSFDTTTVIAGGELEVTIDISGGYGGIGQVVETLPDGFSYVSGSSALVLDDITVDDDGREMVPFSLVGEDTFTYMVAVSSGATPPHTFSGVFTYGIDKDTVNIGESSVTVEQPSTSLSASRSFDTTGSVTAGGELEVTIDISGEYGGIGQVVETLPAGFSYVSGSSALVLDDITVDDDGREMVPFSLVGETTFTYMVAVSSGAMPPHTFSGVFTYGIDKDTVNIGESSVTVEQPSTSLSASRSFNPSAVPAGGGTVEVRVDVRNYENIGKVVETLPRGFSYESGSSALVLDDITVDASGRQMVPFSLVGETSFTYEVTTSSANGLYTFEGTLTYSIEKLTAKVGGPRIRVGPAPSTGTGGTGGGGGSGGGGATGVESTPAPAVPADNPPIIAGGTREEFNVSENMTAVTSLSVVDGRTVTWNISGGFDAAEFTIGAESGELMFKAAPDFENPTDEGANNVYVVVVGATDSDTLSDTLLVLVTVTDVVDESTPTPEPTATPEPTVEPTATPEPTAVPTVVVATATPVATSMPEPTATSMPEPTATSMPAPTATSAPVATATSMPAAIATSMPAPTATSMPEPEATSMPEPTATSMPAPTAVAPEEPGGGFPILVVGLIALVVVGAGAAFYIRSRR